MKTFVKSAVQQIPIVYPKHIAKLITQEAEFYPLVYYIEHVKPIEGELGIYNGHRVVVDLPVKESI